MNDAEKKQLAETIALQLNTDLKFDSNEAKIVKLYAYTMLFFEENNIQPNVDNFVKNKHDIENYIKEKTKNDSNVSSIVKVQKNNNETLKKVVAIVVICILVYFFIKSNN